MMNVAGENAQIAVSKPGVSPPLRGVLIGLTAGLMLALSVILFLTPPFKVVFDDFGAELPVLTVFVLRFGSALAGLPLLTGGVMIALLLCKKESRTVTVITGVLCAITLGEIVLLLCLLLLPMGGLTDGL